MKRNKEQGEREKQNDHGFLKWMNHWANRLCLLLFFSWITTCNALSPLSTSSPTSLMFDFLSLPFFSVSSLPIFRAFFSFPQISINKEWRGWRRAFRSLSFWNKSAWVFKDSFTLSSFLLCSSFCHLRFLCLEAFYFAGFRTHITSYNFLSWCLCPSFP